MSAAKKTAAAAKAAAPAKETKPAKAEKPKVEKDSKNGVTRPKAGTQTGQVWETADKITAKQKGKHASRKQVMETLGESINQATIATQYGKWRRYNGIKGRDAADTE